MAQSWENFMPDEFEQIESSEKWKFGQVAIAKDFSALLQQAWLRPIEPMVSHKFPLTLRHSFLLALLEILGHI